MSKRISVSAALAVVIAMSSCGDKSSGGTTASFSDELAGVCRTINRGIGGLDATTSLDDVRSNATEASALYEDGLNELKKLKVPTSDKEFAADVNDLIASFEDQLDSLDAIAKAARENDQGAVDERISKLTDQATESNDLADSLDISRCRLDGIPWLVKDDGGSAATSTTTTIDLFGSTTGAGPTTTSPLPSTIPGAAITGDTPCPAADGSAARTITFAKEPPTCIDAAKKYTAVVTTNMGAYTVELDAANAPITVNNFVVLARYHYFDNTICHRAIKGFVVQCGDPSGTGRGLEPGYTIADELPATGAYKIGSLAMANIGQPNTGGSQFFLITGAEGVSLPTTYSLFGQVTDGLDTTVKTLEAASNPADGPPLQQIVIESVTITEA